MDIQRQIKIDKEYKNRQDSTMMKNMAIVVLSIVNAFIALLPFHINLITQFVVILYVLFLMLCFELYMGDFLRVKEDGMTKSLLSKYSHIPCDRKVFITSKQILLRRFTLKLVLLFQGIHFVTVLLTPIKIITRFGLFTLDAIWPTLGILFVYAYYYIALNVMRVK